MSASTMSPEATDDEVQHLVSTHMDLAASVARRYSRAGEVDEDVLQEARLGLVSAARRYRRSLGGFVPFALVTMTGTVKKHFRNTAWIARTPRSVQEDALLIRTAERELTGCLQRHPTRLEIASWCGFSAARYERARHADAGRSAEQDVVLMAETGPAPGDPLDPDLDRELGSLHPDDRSALLLHVVGGVTQAEIASSLGVSQVEVSRRLSKVRARLKRRLAA